MTQPPYSEATVDLLARVEFDADQQPEALFTWEQALPFVRKAYRDRARAGLDALAAAGLLLPEGAETRTEWAIRNGLSVTHCRSRERAEHWQDITGVGEVVIRTVVTTSWDAARRGAEPDEASRT